MVDMHALEACAYEREGSNPSSRTISKRKQMFVDKESIRKFCDEQLKDIKADPIKHKIAIIHSEIANADCKLYMKNKIKVATNAGFSVELVSVGNKTDLSRAIDLLNYECVPYIVQLPLNFCYDKDVFCDIRLANDIDNLGYEAKQKLYVSGNATVSDLPCTARGIYEHLKHLNGGQDLMGNNVCIIGRSDLVGRPLEKWLRDYCNCNTIVLHRGSSDDYKKAAIRMSDIVVVAVGNVYTFKDFIDWGHLFADRIVYDVGINWAKKPNEDGELRYKLCGDIPEEWKEWSRMNISPVPGGVGVLTRTFFVVNAWEKWKACNPA